MTITESKNESIGVESFFRLLFAAGYDVRVLAGKKIASVGKITEKKLLEYGIRCDYVPEDHTGEGLGRLLASLLVDHSRILLLQGNLADDTLLKLLPQATRWVVYETLPVAEFPEWKREAVVGADAVVFASTSAVENFCSVILSYTTLGASPLSGSYALWVGERSSESKDLNRESLTTPAFCSPRLAFCIGRMTESAARMHGFETVTSDETTMDSLVKKIVEHYKKES